jgi:hypothetical protein
MLRRTRLNSIVVPVLALAALTLASTRADAQVKAFKFVGGGGPQPLPLIPLTPGAHMATGVGTELGAYTGAGTLQILRYTSPLTADFSSASPFVFVAADGSRLAVTYGDVTNGAMQPGKLTLTVVGGTALNPVFVATFVAEFNPVPAACTGRFANVTAGSFITVAQSSPFRIVGASTTPFNYTWAGDGWIQYKQ